MKLSKDERPRKKKSFHRRSSAQRERSQIEAGESASNNKEINTNEAFFKCHISLNVYKRNIEVTCEPVSGVNTVFFVSPLRSWCAFSFEVDFLSRIKWKLEKKFHKCREHHCCFRDIGGRRFFFAISKTDAWRSVSNFGFHLSTQNEICSRACRTYGERTFSRRWLRKLRNSRNSMLIEGKLVNYRKAGQWMEFFNTCLLSITTTFSTRTSELATAVSYSINQNCYALLSSWLTGQI